MTTEKHTVPGRVDPIVNRHSNVITGARVAHDDAAVCDLESVRRETEQEIIHEVRAEPGVQEAFALQTCHRVEVYVVTDKAETGRAALSNVGFGPDEAVSMDHEASIRHLMRVAAGLESVVVGEDQIIGQVRDAFTNAKEGDSIGPLLGEAVQKAIRVGERARNETAINEGAVSLGSAAVELADREFGVAGKTATVVGIGEMGTLTMMAFASSDVHELFIANRTTTHAEDKADVHNVDAEILGLDALPDHVPDTDIIIVATAATEPVIDESTLEAAGETYVIDLGQPRDVAPEASVLDAVTLRDLDDLKDVTEETERQRAEAMEQVNAIIDEEFDRLVGQYKRKRADEVIGAMYEGADRIKRRELQTALSRLDADSELTDDQRQIVETFAESLISQLLAAPTRALREAAEDDDWSTIATAIRLFDPELEQEAGFPEHVTSRGSDRVPLEAEDD